MNVFLYTLAGTAIAMVLVSEGGAFLARLNHRLVRRVLRQLPKELPEALRRRWTEEIEGDLETYAEEPLRGLWFALCLRWRGARYLAAELLLQIVLSEGPVATPRAAEQTALPQSNPVTANTRLVNAYATELKERLGYEGLEERHERRPESE